jgi:hypothetical protein
LHQIGDLQTNPGIYNWLFPFFIGERFWLLPRVLRYDVDSTRENILAVMLVIFNLYIANNILQHNYGISCLQFMTTILSGKGIL